jgi:hypothetical protein
VKSVTLNTGATRSYGYDASGNLISDNAGFSARYYHANLATKRDKVDKNRVRIFAHRVMYCDIA